MPFASSSRRWVTVTALLSKNKSIRHSVGFPWYKKILSRVLEFAVHGTFMQLSRGRECE
jgi:hypothetical protein